MMAGRTGRLIIWGVVLVLLSDVTATNWGWPLPNKDVTAGAGPLSAAGTNNVSLGMAGWRLSCAATLPGATGAVARRGCGIGMPGAAGDDGAGEKPFTASGDENGGGTRSRLRRRSRVLGWGCCLLVAQPVANVTATPQAIARLIHLFFMFFVFWEVLFNL